MKSFQKIVRHILILSLLSACSSDNDALSDIPVPQGGPITENPDNTGEPGDPDSDSPNPIYLDANGVTIKAHEWAEVGQQGIIDGKTYTIVGNGAIQEMLGWGGIPEGICTSRVTDMSRLFTNMDFNEDISSWDVSNVTDMSSMFARSTFNQPLYHWDVSSVIKMPSMFARTSFNQPLDSWDIGNVLYTSYMFYKSDFNQDIRSWDVSSVTDMSLMFAGSQFNQDLSNWDLSGVLICKSFADDTPQWTLPKPEFAHCDIN
ncbi:BspA family leucine-rich repeat surface protein [Robiginitalea sp. SC105]|uniref:BspA family leucine-rich repeat surface protein n=1 Tax=Robiginitalea sp. SC105 TaxID=2762332 RepID=UPI0016396D3B|nr:BspA family leucine-rich repeat surface protein [Robiginitalea sp. SC105]MBC2839863.1 DUF285 domain-containing protein [Robiginitalea sp. SC105]